jgi:hypothetical protein
MASPAARTGPPRYIVLGVSLRGYSPFQDEDPPNVLCTTGYKTARVVSVRLPDAERGKYRRSGHWRICVEVDRKNVVTARYVASGLEWLLTLLNYGPLEDLSIQLMPPSALRGRTILASILVDRVEETARKERKFYLGRTFKSRLGTFHMLPEILLADAFLQLPTLLQSPWLFAAGAFFHSACRDFSFTGDTITEILRAPSLPLENERVRIMLENIVLSSFRVIEAIVGEPGNEGRFRQRLTDRGLDFDEPVGFRGKRAKRLGSEIYVLQRLRDATSAHGVRRRSRPVTWFEAMEAQHLAHSVFSLGLRNELDRRGRPEGSVEETHYLLGARYPFRDLGDWLEQRFSELGNMTPVEAIRHPGGPHKIDFLAEGHRH